VIIEFFFRVDQSFESYSLSTKLDLLLQKVQKGKYMLMYQNINIGQTCIFTYH